YVANAEITASPDGPFTEDKDWSFTETLFRFHDQNPLYTGEYHATIDWGDETSSSTDSGEEPVEISPVGGGYFDVIGTHTYAEATSLHDPYDPYQVTLSVWDDGGEGGGTGYATVDAYINVDGYDSSDGDNIGIAARPTDLTLETSVATAQSGQTFTI